MTKTQETACTECGTIQPTMKDAIACAKYCQEEFKPFIFVRKGTKYLIWEYEANKTISLGNKVKSLKIIEQYLKESDQHFRRGFISAVALSGKRNLAVFLNNENVQLALNNYYRS